MKRIYRNENDKKVAGICAGLGEQFSIDPTILRLALVFICVATGIWPVLIAYIVGWVIIPDKAELPHDEDIVKNDK